MTPALRFRVIDHRNWYLEHGGVFFFSMSLAQTWFIRHE
jgi:hypothetical protein